MPVVPFSQDNNDASPSLDAPSSIPDRYRTSRGLQNVESSPINMGLYGTVRYGTVRLIKALHSLDVFLSQWNNLAGSYFFELFDNNKKSV